MDSVYGPILELIFEIILFLVLVGIGTFVYNRTILSYDKMSNSGEVLPEDEIHTLKQVFYLIIMSLAFIDILYAIMTSQRLINGLFYFIIFDIVLSVFLAVALDKSSWKGKLILLLLVPFLPS